MQKKRKVLYLVNIAAAAICIVAYSTYDMSNNIRRSDNNYTGIDNGYIFIQLQHESNPINTDVNEYCELYNTLVESETYSYYELYQQPLDMQYIMDHAPSTVSVEQNQYDRVPCVQISSNVISAFEIHVEVGELLSTNEFLYDGTKPIPVCMGSNYMQYCSIGDTFIADYLFDTYTFQVVGILAQGSVINNSLHFIILDDYIVMPSFNLDGDLEQTDGLKIHYANKTSGMIRTLPSEYDQVISSIKPLLDATSAGEYTISSSSLLINFKQLVGMELHAFQAISAILLCITFLFSVITLFQYGIQDNIAGTRLTRVLYYLIFVAAATCVSQLIIRVAAVFMSVNYPLLTLSIIAMIYTACLCISFEVISVHKMTIVSQKK